MLAHGVSEVAGEVTLCIEIGHVCIHMHLINLLDWRCCDILLKLNFTHRSQTIIIRNWKAAVALILSVFLNKIIPLVASLDILITMTLHSFLILALSLQRHLVERGCSG